MTAKILCANCGVDRLDDSVVLGVNNHEPSIFSFLPVDNYLMIIS